MSEVMTDKQILAEINAIISILKDIEIMKGDINDRIHDIATKADLQPKIVKGLVTRAYRNDMRAVADSVSELETLFDRIMSA